MAPPLVAAPWKSRQPLTGRADGGEQRRHYAILRQAAGRGIRLHCGASCPFGSLDRGGCGLVVGDDTACCPRLASIPVGSLPLPATPPPAAPVARRPRLPSRWPAAVGLAAATELCCDIVEDTMPRRKSTSSRPDPAMAALLQTLNPIAAKLIYYVFDI